MLLKLANNNAPKKQNPSTKTSFRPLLPLGHKPNGCEKSNKMFTIEKNTKVDYQPCGLEQMGECKNEWTNFWTLRKNLHILAKDLILVK